MTLMPYNLLFSQQISAFDPQVMILPRSAIGRLSRLNVPFYGPRLVTRVALSRYGIFNTPVSFSSACPVLEKDEAKLNMAAQLSNEIEIVEIDTDLHLEVEREAVKSFKESGYELDNELCENILVLSKHLKPHLKSAIFFDPNEVSRVVESHYMASAIQRQQMMEGVEVEAIEEDLEEYINLNVILSDEKKQTALGIHCALQLNSPEVLHIQRAIPYSDSDLALSMSSESLFQKNSVYTGRDFSELNQDLVEAMERYLRETVGVNQHLVEFILEVSGVKEDDDYHEWLKDLLKFFS
ncbi:unnamed protein product [Kuraishia capsulata CBS 1993]|uniref:Mitochondrial acidic protein MAM33 n=1 Tax=Kuraishia capsulata CBS 1993 TaxID=1382522 RepID=W6MR31_9ASCO|nr:uncharacterized protein KUCA_T00005153001 [Kuraishia capsulata CBS 1993]CDK29166.1 unnamed protein product [Kuraishia capsulata CBS 1993]